MHVCIYLVLLLIVDWLCMLNHQFLKIQFFHRNNYYILTRYATFFKIYSYFVDLRWEAKLFSWLSWWYSIWCYKRRQTKMRIVTKSVTAFSRLGQRAQLYYQKNTAALEISCAIPRLAKTVQTRRSSLLATMKHPSIPTSQAISCYRKLREWGAENALGTMRRGHTVIQKYYL